MRRLCVVALALISLSGCGGDKEPSASTPAVTATVTATITPAAAPAPAEEADYRQFFSNVRELGPLMTDVTDADLRKTGDNVCTGLGIGSTAADLSNPANFPDEIDPYVPSIVALAVVHLCSQYIADVDLSVLRNPVQTATPEPAPSAPSTPKAKPALPASFGDGTYLVGTDIRAGTYRNAGDTYDGNAPCVAYTSRKPSDLGSYIAGSTTTGPSIIVVNAGEYVTATGCKTWRLDR